jgi:hypothetical protein
MAYVKPISFTSLFLLSSSRFGHFTPGALAPGFILIRMLVGHQSRSGRFGEEKNLLRLYGIEQ